MLDHFPLPFTILLWYSTLDCFALAFVPDRKTKMTVYLLTYKIVRIFGFQILFEIFHVRKKVTNIFEDRVVYLKRLFKELMPDLLCFVYCVYHMLIFFNIKLYSYVLATRKVFRRMAKHRWQHKCPLDFPYLRIFKLRISSSCVCFLIRILSNNSPIFLCR